MMSTRPGDPNSNRAVTLALKGLILLSPLPFGCVGRVFAPLFYMLVLLTAVIALGRPADPVRFPRKRIHFALIAFLSFLVLQMVPLPYFLFKAISPAAAVELARLRGITAGFQPLSAAPFETLMFTCRFLVWTVFSWALLRVRLGRGEIRSIFNVLVLSAVFQALLGLAKRLQGNRDFFLFFHPLPANDPLNVYLTGTLANPDHFAFYLGMVLPLTLAVLFFKLRFLDPGPGAGFREKIIAAVDGDRWFALHCLVPVLLGAAILMTGSRAGIMTTAICFLIFGQLAVYLGGGQKLRAKLAVIFVFITAVALFVGVQSTVDKFLGTGQEGGGRFLRWPATLSMAGDHVLPGTGFGTYRYSYFPYDTDDSGKWSTHAHNDYLEVLAEGGIPGAALLFLLIGLVLHAIVTMWRRRGHPWVKATGTGIITALCAVLLHSLLDFSLRIPANMLVFVLLMVLGIQVAAYKRDFQE